MGKRIIYGKLLFSAFVLIVCFSDYIFMHYIPAGDKCFKVFLLSNFSGHSSGVHNKDRVAVRVKLWSEGKLA